MPKVDIPSPNILLSQPAGSSPPPPIPPPDLRPSKVQEANKPVARSPTTPESHLPNDEPVVPHRRPDYGLFIGLAGFFATLVIFVLQSNGVEMDWIFSLALYALAAIGLVWSVLSHATPHLLSWKRWIAACVTFLVVSIPGTLGTLKQYKREQSGMGKDTMSSSEKHTNEQKELITSLVQYVQINRIEEISDELSFNLKVQIQRQRLLSTNPSLHFSYGQFGYEVTYRAREGNWNGDLITPGMTLNSLGVHEEPTEVAFVVRTPKMTEDYVHLKSFSDDLLLPPTIKWDLDQYINNWGESESAIADVLNAQAQRGHVFSDQDIGLLQKQMFQQIKSPDVFVKKLVEDARQYIAASMPH